MAGKESAVMFGGHATTTTSTTSTTSTPISSTSTPKPVLIKTNPTILEAEPLDDSAQPTLPPSLPNLKIIPFLPTDAVQAAPVVKANGYNYYAHSSGGGSVSSAVAAAAAVSALPVSRIDFNLYDDTNLYPSITEKYPLYSDLEEGAKAEYIYKFNVEGPVDTSLVSSTAGKFDGSIGSTAYVKYDFGKTKKKGVSTVEMMGVGDLAQKGGFSPPTKTEGGFLPKEPLILDDDDEDDEGKADHKRGEVETVLDLVSGVDDGHSDGQIVNGLIDITTLHPSDLHHTHTKVIGKYMPIIYVAINVITLVFVLLLLE